MPYESFRLTALQNLSSRSTPKVQIVVLKFDNSFECNDNRIILFNQAIYHTIANLIRQVIDSMKNQTKSIAENWKMNLIEKLGLEKCQHEWNETTSNGDAYRFFVCKHCDSTQNYVPFKDDNPSHFDHCTDICITLDRIQR